MKQPNKKLRGSKALAKPFFVVSSTLVATAVTVIGRVVLFGGPEELINAALATLIAGGFFGLLALFASRWRGAVHAKANRHGVDVKMGVTDKLELNRRSMHQNASAKKRT